MNLKGLKARDSLLSVVVQVTDMICRMLTCPHCHHDHIVKNGVQPNLKQSLLCRHCGKRFVEHPIEIHYSDEFKTQVFKALEERVSLRGIQ